jgi:drug/metabolite transporter (DMT)-like permease
LAKIIEKDKGFITPLLLTALYYFLLLSFWIIFNRKLTKPRFVYVIIAVLDSQANFLNIYAFSIIHFNYAFIINISSVFWTCLLTWIFIKSYKYRKIHILGVSIALLGVAATLYGSMSRLAQIDSLFKDYKGLLLCIGASLLYASSNVTMEIFFESGQDIYEYFPWLGLFGFIISAIEAIPLGEYSSIASHEYVFTWGLLCLALGQAITLVIFTSIAPFFIKRCSASMFNISLVSQIFWSYIVEVIFQESTPKSFIYYIGFVVIIIGIWIFNKDPVIKIGLTMSKNHTNNSIHNSQLNQDVENGSQKSKVSSVIRESLSKNEEKEEIIYSSHPSFHIHKTGLQNKANSLIHN